MSSRSLAMPYQPKGARVLTGPEATQAAQSLRDRQRNVNLWPYAHSFPPPDANRVFAANSIAAPLVATQTVVTSYQVSIGMQFALIGIVQIFNGTGFVDGSGDIAWVNDIDVTPGVTVPQGYPLQGFGLLNFQLGSLQYPWPLGDQWGMPEILKAGQIVRNKVTTSAAITPGEPNFFISIFLGWEWPAVEL